MKQYIHTYRGKIVGLTLLIILRQLLLVVAQYLNGETFVGLVDKNIHYFLWVIVAMLGVWGIVIGLDAFSTLAEENVMIDIQNDIRQDISNKMTQTDYHTYNQQSSGHYLSWLNNDVTTISQKGISQYFQLIRGGAGIVFASVALLRYHWSLLVATIIGFICMFYIPKLFEQRIYQVSSEVTQANEQFVAQLEDQLNGYPIYFAYSLLTRFVSNIQSASHALKLVLMKQVRLDMALVAVNFSINVLFQILLTTIAAFCYFNGWADVGAVAIVGSLADIIFSGLGNMSYQVSSIKSVRPIFDKFEQLSEEQVASCLPTSSSLLYQARDVSLSYEQELIFSGLSFDIRKGDKCLITGASGSGKSSLLRLLLGYTKDFEGELLYQGENIRNISSKQIAQQVYYLSQHSHIFATTVKDNITLGENYSDAQVIEVLTKVGFDEVASLLCMPASALSGGQQQRIALARALIRQPHILICDEITSALDKESTQYIEELLLSQEHLTLIMITHALYANKERFTTEITMSK